jgi:hypothetical protein
MAATAQDDSVQNLLFVRKGRDGSFPKIGDYQAGSSAFYLYRNCIYDFQFKNHKQIQGKVVDIKNDSIYYTVQKEKVNKYDDFFDTTIIHPSTIKKINLSGNLMTIPFVRCRIKRYNYSFETSDSAKQFQTRTDTVYGYDSSYYIAYEIVPHMRSWGLDQTSLRSGESESLRPPLLRHYIEQPTYTIKKVLWFTPSKASEIRGVNLSLQTTNFSNVPLTVRGVNLGIDILSAYATMMFMFEAFKHNDMSKIVDTIDQSEKTVTVHGFHASIGGFGGDEFKGVAINGGICMARQGYGFILTGFQNVVDDFRGITIATLRNRSIRGAGLQIGLLNTCKHLKGVQIGLWNVNSKRSLPFINWNFKSS